MAAHPDINHSPFSTSASPQSSSRMATSPPQLPLFADVDSSGNSSFRSKNSTTSSSSKLQRSTRSIRSVSKHSDKNIALSKKAQMENDAMVYLEGPQIYSCGQCRTPLTSHDDIISKSFHGRKGKWYYSVISWCLMLDWMIDLMDDDLDITHSWWAWNIVAFRCLD